MINKLIQIFKNHKGVQYLSLLLLLVLTKIPVFTGKHLLIDGDEAILGIMAQDLLELKSLPLFFYGQQYGFSFFEVLGICVFEPFLGPSFFSVKLGALLVWSAGLWALYRIALHYSKSYRFSLLMAVLFMLYPGWYYWSMKARGGYVTAFALSALVLQTCMTVKHHHNKKIILLSILNGLIFVAHPLWLLISLPLSGFHVFYNYERKWLKSSGFILITILSAIIFKLPSYLNRAVWKPYLFDIHNGLNISEWLGKAWNSLTNFFYFGLDYEVPLFVSVSVIADLLLFIMAVYHAGSGNFGENIHIPLLLSAAGLAFVPFFMSLPDSRYLLPFGTALMFIIAAGMRTKMRHLLQNRLRIMAFSILIPVLGISDFAKLPAHWHSMEINDRIALRELIDHLEKKNINHVISADHALQYRIMYHTDQKIKARYLENDRISSVMDEVNGCFFSNNCRTAVVGLLGMTQGLENTQENWHEELIYINDRYYVFESPDYKALTKAGFKMKYDDRE